MSSRRASACSASGEPGGGAEPPPGAASGSCAVRRGLPWPLSACFATFARFAVTCSLTAAGMPACSFTSCVASSADLTTLSTIAPEKIATTTANPSEKPTCLSVFSAPEPTPATCGGSEPIAAAAIVGIVNPMPAPRKITRQAASYTVDSPFSCASSVSPTAKNRQPITAGVRGPILSTRRPTLGATRSPVSGIGVTAIAASSSL